MSKIRVKKEGFKMENMGFLEFEYVWFDKVLKFLVEYKVVKKEEKKYGFKDYKVEFECVGDDGEGGIFEFDDYVMGWGCLYLDECLVKLMGWVKKEFNDRRFEKGYGCWVEMWIRGEE